MSWVLKVARWDARSAPMRLLAMTSAIVLGVAILVAISSFRDNLKDAIDEESKALLGADLLLASRQPLTAAHEKLFSEIPGESSLEISFASMVHFPKSDGRRLVQVSALKGDFPYFGELETEPPEASRSFQGVANALVDSGLMTQFDVAIGDTLRLGSKEFKVSGRLRRVPGEVEARGMIAPRVYISEEFLDETRLIQRGSVARHKKYFLLPEGTNADELVKSFGSRFDELALRVDTVETRKQKVGRAIENVYTFLSLVGFIALLLGAIGTASAVSVWANQKVRSAAILRCLGARARDTFRVFLIQAFLGSILSCIVGVIVGVFVQFALPVVLSDLLPAEVPVRISWPAVGLGMFTGISISLLFCLIPLVGVRYVSPMQALRLDYEAHPKRGFYRWKLYLLLVLAVLLLAGVQVGSFKHGLSFVIAIFVIVLILALLAALLSALCKRIVPKSLPYIWRQGFSNVFRPENQTRAVIVSLGLGTFLVTILLLCRDTLLAQVNLSAFGVRPDLILFDVQRDQREDLVAFATKFGLPQLDLVPIVNMRLRSVNERGIVELLSNKSLGVPRWTVVREYRSTYRSHLTDSEKLIAGHWPPQEPTSDIIPVSIEKDISEYLKVNLGDELVFDVQGVELRTVVKAVREVDWKRIQPNFFVVFPEGVIDEAPQFFVFVTRAGTQERSAKFQRAVAERFPNVSSIDLALVLDTIEKVLSQVGFVIQFIGLFSIATGLVVLCSAVLSSRRQRVREGVLLKCLGAKSKTIQAIVAIESAFLGSFAGITGILASLAAGELLSRYIFETPLVIDWTLLGVVLLAVLGITVIFGYLGNRAAYRTPVAEALRSV